MKMHPLIVLSVALAMLENGQIALVGGLQDLETGRVTLVKLKDSDNAGPKR